MSPAFVLAAEILLDLFMAGEEFLDESEEEMKMAFAVAGARLCGTGAFFVLLFISDSTALLA